MAKRRPRKLRKRILYHPLMAKTLALAVSGLGRLYLRSMEYRFQFHEPDCNPVWACRPTIFACWHEYLLFPAYTHARYLATFISEHRDGEFLAQILRMFRAKAIRGSTTRQSTTALRRLIREGQVSHLGIALDGPRGPRRVVQPGAIFLAARAGMPIIPLGFAFQDCWRANSWDRLAVPKPDRVLLCIADKPIRVPSDADRGQIEDFRQRLQDIMDGLQTQADEFVAGRGDRTRLLSLRQVLSPEVVAADWFVGQGVS